MKRWQEFVVLVLATAITGAAVHFARLVFVPQNLPHIPWVTYVHPNVAKLHAAQQLADAGQLAKAREILVRALTTAPRSPVTRELRDLLGAINTQLFFEKEPSPRKAEYTVTRGDALFSIARKLRSSTDAIMRVNALDSTLLRPGDKLVIPKLEFTITIDLPRERVIVHDGHGFFTQYPIASVDLPRTRGNQVQAKVTAKSFWEDGKPVSRTEEGSPWIFLSRRGYVLYGVEESSEASDPEIALESSTEDSDSPDANRPPQGIAMLREDIEELELLIRRGTPVTIILQRR